MFLKYKTYFQGWRLRILLFKKLNVLSRTLITDLSPLGQWEISVQRGYGNPNKSMQCLKSADSW